MPDQPDQPGQPGYGQDAISGGLLGREDILKAQDIETEIVEVPEWAGSVRVRGLSGQERDEFEASTMVMRGKQMVPDQANFRAKLACRCLVDDQGDPLFSQRDVYALGQKSGAALDRVFTVASRLSGLSEADVEELQGNSPAAQSGDSISPSPGNLAAP